MSHYFHVGVAVPDLEAAMEELSSMYRLEWGEPVKTSIAGHTMQATFSRGGEPYIELVEGTPGSPWDAAAGAHLHHLGCWSTDLEADTERALAAGATMWLDLREFGAPGTMLRAPKSGMAVELLDATAKDSFDEQYGG